VKDLAEVAAEWELHKWLKEPERWLTRQIKAGRIRARKVGPKWLMTDDDVAYALEVFANRPAPAAAQATTQPADPAADPADDTAVDVPSIAISAASRRRRLTQVAAS